MSGRLRMLLIRPLLPMETRLRLRQQRYDEEATRRSRPILATPDMSVTLAEVVGAEAVGGDRSKELVRAFPRVPENQRSRRPRSMQSRWYVNGNVHWNGTQVVAVGTTPVAAGWTPEPGGLHPGFDAAEVARAGIRPVTSGESSPRIAAIAAVGLAGHHVYRVYFLDVESRALSHLPAVDLPLDDVARVARAAGVDYRRYVIQLAKFSSLRLHPNSLCEVLFPRSVFRVKLLSEEDEGALPDAWYTERWSPPWAGGGKAGS